MTHTPTPWQTHDKESTRQSDKWVPVWKDGIVIATCWTEEKNTDAMVNAAFIVRAVNSHDALVKALDACVTELSAYYDGRNDEDADTDEALTLAAAALAKAKAEP